MDTTTSGNDSMVVSFLTIRKAVGILGLTLPVALVTGSIIIGNCSYIETSISDYYYTRMGNFLIGALCAVALFLFCYKGFDRRDRIASNLAALFALGIAFFPTMSTEPASICRTVCTNSTRLVSTLHNISAGLFFITLAFISLKLFTIKALQPTPKKLQRNAVYRFCGWTILVAVGFIFLYMQLTVLHATLERYKPVFSLEAVALWAFGMSWITKGGALLKDD